MEIDDEDEVIGEYDVIYSGEHSDSITLMQYPLIPKGTLIENSINSLSINKKDKTLQMEKFIDINYLDQRAHNLTTVQTLNGQSIEQNTNLLVGVVRNGKMFLSPIANINQFRHDFSNLENEAERNSILHHHRSSNKKEQFGNGNNNMNSNKKIVSHKDDTSDANVNQYTKLELHLPGDIESIKVLDDIVNISDTYMNNGGNNSSSNVDYLTKEEYYDLLLKYINDKSVIDELNEKAIPPDNTDIIPERQFHKKKEKVNNQHEDVIMKDNNSDININKHDVVSSNSSNTNDDKEMIINEMITKLFGKNECLYFDDVVERVCKEINVEVNSKECKKDVERLKESIRKCCVVCKGDVCFLKRIGDGDDDVNEVRLKLIECIGNGEGMKKQQIKMFIKEMNVDISDSKLTKVLKSICDYSNMLWSLKKPSK